MHRPILLLLSLALAGGAAEARTIVRKDRQLDFRYSWPALPPRLPRLEAWLAAHADEARRSAKAAAVERWATESRDSGEDPPRHSYEKAWLIAAATPRLLSLSAGSQFYTGGAHEGLAYDALLWDRKTDSPLALPSLFTDSRRALAAMEKAYCAELRSNQSERRGDGFREEDFQCPAMAREPVVLTGKGAITGFEVLLDPYQAGSWAEGPYEVEVRFSRPMLKLVKPEYRAAFGR